jgi:hypothetical protein
MDRWVSCSREMDYLTSLHRHIVKKGKPTSACGATAFPITIWRGNSTKPKCPVCLERAADPDFPY